MTSSEDRLFVGADIGGSTVEAVVVNASNEVVARASLPTRTGDGDRVLAGTVETLRAVLDECPADDIAAMGVGIPGQVDLSSGSVRLAMNLDIGEEGFPIGPKIEAEFGFPTTVENDVRTAALGAFERYRPLHPELRVLAYLGIGTGVSAGLVIDGSLHRGRAGMAGEIGHVVVSQDGPPCRCGLSGCLEAVAAGPAIARLWPRGGDHPAEDLFRAADNGDPEAGRAATIVAAHLARAVELVAFAYDPDLVVLGGGVGSVGDPLLSAVGSRLIESGERSALVRDMVPPERLVSIPKGLAIGATGAAAVARTRFGGDGGVVHPTVAGRVP